MADCPILRCFLRAVDDQGDGAGSAEEILKMLRTVNKDSQLLKGAEKLPNNSSAMGKWLQKYQFALSAHRDRIDSPAPGFAQTTLGLATDCP